MNALFANFITRVAFEYPLAPNYQVVQNYREFFEALQYVESDRTYANYLKQVPIDPYLNNKSSLMEWVEGMTGKIQVSADLSDNVWKYLFMICASYPNLPSFQTILQYKNFFLKMENVFPSILYRKQYVNQMRYLPVDQYTSSRQLMMEWITRMYQSMSETNTEYTIEKYTDYNSHAILISAILIGCVFIYKLM